MCPKCLLAKHHVDSETGCMYRYIYSESEYFSPHSHDYFEVFLTVCNDIIHIANGKTQILKEGSLVLVRPSDVHTYEYDGKRNFNFVNLTFTTSTASLLFKYLSEAFPSEKLIGAKFPPTILLSKNEKLQLFTKFEELRQVKWHDKKQLKLKMRTLLVEIFTRYFFNINDMPESSIPFWLESLCEQMKKQKNFIEGIEKMVSLSKKSREHIARCLKKYYGVTSTEFINDLRLNYAANMLLNSNVPILDLCFECGFQNISWFYTLFKKNHGVSPDIFRKRAQMH